LHSAEEISVQEGAHQLARTGFDRVDRKNVLLEDSGICPEIEKVLAPRLKGIVDDCPLHRRHLGRISGFHGKAKNAPRHGNAERKAPSAIAKGSARITLAIMVGAKDVTGEFGLPGRKAAFAFAAKIVLLPPVLHANVRMPGLANAGR
jgi:hypothetical protein